jgi:thioesterase domain-containing protein
MEHTENRPVIDRFLLLSEDKKKLLALRLLDADRQRGLQQEKKLVGFIVGDEGVNAEEAVHHLRRSLPQYMLPSRIAILDALPRTPNGKLDRVALIQTALLSATPRQTESVRPIEDSVESELEAIWRRLLRVEAVLPHDNFFDLGGHSLLAVRMLAQIEARFGQDIPVSLIIEAPTIARLAAHLRSAAPRANAIVTLQPVGDAPPVFFLPLHIHGALHYRHLVAHLGQDRPVYGLPGFKVMQAEGGLPTVEALASVYVEDLLHFQPKGPYYLCGISIAGLLTYEMGRQLYERGIEDVKVILLDTYGPDYPHRLSLDRALAQMLISTYRPIRSLPTRLGDTGMYWLQRAYAALKTYRSQRRDFYSEDGDNQDPNYDSDAINE